jgi:hypothetical protein
MAATLLTVASLLVAWVPPIGPMLHHLGDIPVPGALTLSLAISQAAAVGILALLAAAIIAPRTP